MRKLLVVAILLLLSVMPAVAQVSVEIPNPFDHHAHGVVGTMSTSWLTVVTPDNHIVQILVPANFRMPKDVQAGKPVACAYKINDQQQNILVRIKPEDGQKSSKNTFVDTVPHF